MAVDQLQKEPAGEPGLGPAPPERANQLNPERWLEEYGDALFGFTILRVRNRTVAQDLVQETFLAALRASQSFAGRSTERAWLFGILHNKLADHYRLQSRETPLTDVDSLSSEEDAFFHSHGLGKDGWKRNLAPRPWETPDESLVSKEFQGILNGCVSQLPEKVAQVFLWGEVDGITSAEICKDLSISPNNLWVMLHRARMALRRCLEVHWFGHKQTDG